MISKQFFRKTQTILFIVISSFSIISVITLYLVISTISDSVFTRYKQSYFTEQTYNMSYILRSQMKGLTITEVNKNTFQSVSDEFSIPFELLNKDLNDVLFKNELDYAGYEESFDVEVPIITDGKLIGYLRAYYDLENPINSPALTLFNQKINDTRRYVLQIGVALILIASFIVAKVLSKQIQASSTSALQVLKGNREEFIPRRGTEEVKQLIDSTNGLLVEFNNLESWRKQMMEDLTHELRTPLTSVLMRMEAIIDGIYPTTEKNLQDIYDEVDRLSRLVISVQKLSEAEGARFKLNIKKVNVINLVKGTYEGFLFIAKQKEIQLYFKHPNKPCTAYIDPDRIIQVVTNIISNALEYTPKGGKIEVGIESYEDELIIYCQDNGIGISEEDISFVFHRFYRTDKSRSRERGGSGIGLSISKALIHAHGGEIGVDSEPCKGSRFWAKLPTSNDGLVSKI